MIPIIAKRRHEEIVNQKENKIKELNHFIEKKNNEINILNCEIKKLNRKSELDVAVIKNLNIEKEILSKSLEKNEIKIDEFRNLLIDKIEKVDDLSQEVTNKTKEISILKTFLSIEADKMIKRYENIQRRTKKARVKIKCERKIEEYMLKKITYERSIGR
jgi:hypothetical protein